MSNAATAASGRILIVDDEVEQMKALRDTLPAHGYETVGCSNSDAALAALRETRFDLLLTDLMMPDISGIVLLQRCLEIQPDLIGIIMTGQGTINSAVEAMKVGALDYILKPFKLSFILPVLSRALVVRRLRMENAALEQRLREYAQELEIANQEKSERLAYLASYDALTGLPNVRLFGNRLEQFVGASRQEHKSVCVVAVDLDRFTQINDTLGRNVGDEVLREVAARFHDFLAEPYALTRIAGDEFAAASPELAPVKTKLCEQLFDALKMPFHVGGQEMHITARAGVAYFPADGDDGGIVFKNAEAALKLAKSSGRSSLYYSSEMNARVAERLAFEEHLRVAAEAQQFVMHYQPRVDMISGEIVGAEALIRWQHPDRGLIGPAEFIALAEETGLIVPIGTWALRAVCAQQAAWLAAGDQHRAGRRQCLAGAIR